MMRNKVIAAVLAASAGWGLAGVGTRASYGAGATTLTVLSIRSIVASLTLTGYVVAAVGGAFAVVGVALVGNARRTQT